MRVLFLLPTQFTWQVLPCANETHFLSVKLTERRGMLFMKCQMEKDEH